MGGIHFPPILKEKKWTDILKSQKKNLALGIPM